MTTKPLLEVKHFTKRYGSLTAISDVSFSLQRGEILGLIGPNGSGKTTLFECLGGALAADTGYLSIEGRQLSPKERASLLFYLPDAISPWPEQTLGWAFKFCVGLFAGRRDAYEEVVGSLKLQALVDKKIGTLSKGQRKRALLALGRDASAPAGG